MKASVLRRRGARAFLRLSAAGWRQIGWITVGAVAVFCFSAFFRPERISTTWIFESPEETHRFLRPVEPAVYPRRGRALARDDGADDAVATNSVGERVQGTLTLKTASGKRIAPEDLLVVQPPKNFIC